jgi:hypothetical protein
MTLHSPFIASEAQRSLPGSGLNDLRFLHIVHFELENAGFEEFLFILLEVALSPFLQKVKKVDKAFGELQILLGPFFQGIFQQAELHQRLRVQWKNDGAEIQRRKKIIGSAVRFLLIGHGRHILPGIGGKFKTMRAEMSLVLLPDDLEIICVKMKIFPDRESFL